MSKERDADRQHHDPGHSSAEGNRELVAVSDGRRGDIAPPEGTAGRRDVRARRVLFEVQLEETGDLEREEAEEDHEIERPRRKALAELAEDAWASEPSDDSDRADDPEETEDAQAGHTTEEV